MNQTIGAYSNEVRREIITIVDKQEYRALMDYIRKVDPKAFVTVYAVSEMRYQSKKWQVSKRSILMLLLFES